MTDSNKPSDTTAPAKRGRKPDAVDSSANVSAAQEEKASPGTAPNAVGRKVIFNANGMKLEGEITEAKADGGAKIDVDGTEYEATGYGFGKSQFYGPDDEVPGEFKANANAR